MAEKEVSTSLLAVVAKEAATVERGMWRMQPSTFKFLWPLAAHPTWGHFDHGNTTKSGSFHIRVRVYDEIRGHCNQIHPSLL
ncbi:hypothetical protein QYF36_018512 [Acer negundo]|nr:hypothetical protein QYF36_018512 [Acer negundo]